MKLAPLSNTERQAAVDALLCGVRLDGRGLLDNREVSIEFGKDFGCCIVSLGETRVLAQVSCEVVEPRPSRPNEGKIVTSVHITPMAGPEYEQGRTNDAQDELQQLLESNIRESRCLDLEVLCILAEESVWQLRVDVTVMNACGNLGDACNMAAVAALKHFHRPDVTVEEDGRVTVHSFAERAPIPTFLKKVPVCLTYAFCRRDEEELIVFTDPTDLEERVVLGKLVVGLNPHGEITSMNFPGMVMLEKKHIIFCISNAFQRAKEYAELVDRLVEADLKKRENEIHPTGFVNKLSSDLEMRKKRMDKKVEVMRGMSSLLRSVRDQMDATTSDMKREVEAMDDDDDDDDDDEGEQEDNDDTSSSDGSEEDNKSTSGDSGDSSDSSKESSDSKKDSKNKDKDSDSSDSDSEEEVKENIKTGIL